LISLETDGETLTTGSVVEPVVEAREGQRGRLAVRRQDRRG
jgi:hypothetical protein